ncbi:MAG: hypothetical protein ACREQH_03610 [Candidatus Binatus sp.]
MKICSPGILAACSMLAVAVFVSPMPALAADGSEVGSKPAATINLTNFQAASVVIGQVSFSGGLENQGLSSPTADALSGGFGAIGVGPTGTIYLSDYNNQRVLGFNAIPSSNDAAADFVLGQPNFTSTGRGTAANQFGGPQSPVVFKDMLFVSDFYDSRVLIWKKAPTSDQVNANIVIGQTHFGTSTAACGAKAMSAPETLSVAGGRLVVADSSNARVLIYNKIPKKSGKKPNIVLGQNNLTTCVTLNNGSGVSGAPSAANFSYPAGVWTDGTRLVVTDEDESRVLIWKTFPKKNFQNADIVLGQPDFTSDVVNNNGSGGSGAPSASNMNMPYDGVFSNGTQLFIGDEKNQRVLVWNTFPTATFAPADVVLGQPNFTCGVENNDGSGCTPGGPAANNLDNPRGITQVNNQLIIDDGGNNRYLIYNGM